MFVLYIVVVYLYVYSAYFCTHCHFTPETLRTFDRQAAGA